MPAIYRLFCAGGGVDRGGTKAKSVKMVKIGGLCLLERPLAAIRRARVYFQSASIHFLGS